MHTMKWKNDGNAINQSEYIKSIEKIPLNVTYDQLTSHRHKLAWVLVGV